MINVVTGGEFVAKGFAESVKLFRDSDFKEYEPMGAGKTDKEEYLASKIKDILGNESVTDVRISSTSGERIVGIKFENSVEVHMHYNPDFEFSHFKISNSGPGKVLAQTPKFTGSDTDTEVLTFCYNLLKTDKGQKFIKQVGRYFRVFEDDRVELT